MQNYVGNALAGFQQGRQMRQDMETQRAMAALVGNPDDPQAMQRLAQFNPQAAMQTQQQMQQQALQEIEAKQDKILMGAQLFRAAKARAPQAPDDQVYASVLPALQQMGIDTSSLPQPGDPQLGQYLQSVLSIADALDPKNPAQDPGIIREYDIARQRGLIPEGTSYQQYVTLRNPGAQTPVILPNNVTPVGGGGQDLPRISDAAGYNALPPGSQYIDPNGNVRTKGGQSGAASAGNF